MRLFYYKDPAGNFGDDLNSWIWAPFLGDDLTGEGVNLSVIGTLIGPMMRDRGPWIVLGSGAGYGPPPADFGGQRWQVACVRGPLTARLLGLDQSLALVDPAVLVRRHSSLERMERGDKAAFMPHHSVVEQKEWRWAAEDAGLDYIDPRDDSREIVRRISGAKVLVADAMHGAIVADALRVPWVAVSTSRETSTFKWLDWASSLNLKYDPVLLPSVTLAERMRSFGLQLYGRSYRTAPNAEAALRHVKADYRAKSPRLSHRKRQIGRKASLALRDTVVLAAGYTGYKERGDRLRRDAVAEALRRAAELPGQLSDDRTLDDKENMLMAKIDLARRLARGR